MRGSSQNARFAAQGIRGVRLVEALAAGLRARGLEVLAPEAWRGLGFRLLCRLGASEVEVTLVDLGGEVTLQVAATRSLSLAERLRAGRHPDAEECYAVAAVVHAVLSEDARCAGVRWRWDGPPHDGDLREPTPRP
jgi:hypothetical protein